MQWADLRGLSSWTRRVARMNTIAARRLPLLLRATPSSRALLSPAKLQWPRNDTRHFSAGIQLCADVGKKRQPRKQKQKSPSLFEELFPDDDVSSSAYQGKGQDHRDAAATAAKNGGGSNETATAEAPQVKVRFMTSANTDMSESTEYRRRVQEHKNKARRAKHEAPAKVADILESRSRAMGQAKAADEESSSIFSELFSSTEPGTKGSPSGQPLAEDRPVNHADLQSWLDSLPKSDVGTDTQQEPTRSAMLVLSNTSPNLLESDFYRIGPQGQHLDGWSASIRKVMQAYDYNTLEPMDRYFILFDSHAAAAAYQKEAQRLHSVVRRSLESPVSPLATQPASSIFTLAPPSKAPLSLHLYKLDRATEARLDTFSIHGLLSMTPEPPPRANSHVVLSLEGGTLDQRTLSQLIRRDARDRNLGWPVQHMRPYFAPKVDRRTVAAVESAVPEESGWDSDAAPALVDAEGLKGGGAADETAMSARFVLSFPDVHEARRFVRAWHRKELVLSKTQSLVANTHFVW
ncbi:hypothetical protein EsH8_VIII_000662 [Colletotrichum jinshuiense]